VVAAERADGVVTGVAVDDILFVGGQRLAGSGVRRVDDVGEAGAVDGDAGDVGNGERVGRAGVRRRADGRIVDRHGYRVALLAVEIQRRAGFEEQFGSDDLEGRGIGAAQAERIVAVS